MTLPALPELPGGDFIAARRGMVCVHAERHHDAARGECDTYTIGIVTSVTRDGIVRSWRDSRGLEQDGPGKNAGRHSRQDDHGADSGP
jgi:hypothetical protein